MTELFKARDTDGEARAYQLYGQLVQQARLPAFYSHHGVPDTPDGRFDMIVLHAVLVLRRLKRDHERTQKLAQAIFDLMFADMDQNLREMGVGDMSIGKRIKGMAKAFYGRLASYDDALNGADDAALTAALRRNLYRKASPTPGNLAAMAAYMSSEAARLDAAATDDLVSGRMTFGPPPANSSSDGWERESEG
ncbi:MAG: ubiquinol-cytochrome C chaperone family protein [Rhodospirillales bacterium]|nr:ubiquinol-cytochrome C chaperone family protein [Rhodospirillales bacterium]